MLPQGKAFLLLSRFTFGLFREENVEDGTIIEKALTWIGSQTGKAPSAALRNKIKKAVDFHNHALDLGETLECFPDRVAELLDIFDGVDGYETKPWDSLPSNPLIRQNLIKNQQQRRQEKTRRFYRRESSGVDGLKTGLDLSGRESAVVDGSKTNIDFSGPVVSGVDGSKKGIDLSRHESFGVDGSKTKIDLSRPVGSGVDGSKQGIDLRAYVIADKEDGKNDITAFALPEKFELLSLSQEELVEISSLFCEADENNICSCIKLAEVVGTHRSAAMGVTTESIFDTQDWQVYSVQVDSKPWFKAVFNPKDIRYRADRGYGANWLKKKPYWRARPGSFQAASSCVPPEYRRGFFQEDRVAAIDRHLTFDDMTLAVQMEAAFWLELQFYSNKLHWYDRKEGAAQLLKELYQPPEKKQKKEAMKTTRAGKKAAAKKAKEKQQRNAARKVAAANS
jgi:hypothetical protein